MWKRTLLCLVIIGALSLAASEGVEMQEKKRIGTTVFNFLRGMGLGKKELVDATVNFESVFHRAMPQNTNGGQVATQPLALKAFHKRFLNSIMEQSNTNDGDDDFDEGVYNKELKAALNKSEFIQHGNKARVTVPGVPFPMYLEKHPETRAWKITWWEALADGMSKSLDDLDDEL